MPVSYVLRENLLTADPNDYVAGVISNQSVELESLIDRMIERGSTVTRADIFSVMEDLQGAIQGYLQEGSSITTPFANFTSSIRGVFNGSTDAFESGRHAVVPVVNPGARLRDFYRTGIPVNKQEKSTKNPVLLEYLDHNSGERNSIVSPGGIASIKGYRLNFDRADINQGIFFIAQDGSETRVENLGHNKPSQLMFMIPAGMASGNYILEVRIEHRGSIVSGRLPEQLTVS